MNNKQFLDKLGKCLLKLGANEHETYEQVQKMDAYLRSKGIEDVDFDPERIAAGMMPKIRAERIEKNKGTVKTDKAEKVEKNEKTEKSATAKPTEKENTEKPKATNEPKTSRTSEKTEQHTTRPPVTEMHQRSVKTQAPVKKHDDEDLQKVDQNFDYVDNKNQTAKTSGSKNFWILFSVVLPFAIALSAAEIALFAGLSIALAILSLALFAVIVAITAVGGAVSLIGIIYGAYQIIKGLVPIGLFEIGLGITVGASVMLAGVIMYNIAVRFVPFAIKQMFKLTKLYFSTVRDIFYYAKRSM